MQVKVAVLKNGVRQFFIKDYNDSYRYNNLAYVWTMVLEKYDYINFNLTKGYLASDVKTPIVFTGEMIVT